VPTPLPRQEREESWREREIERVPSPLPTQERESAITAAAASRERVPSLPQVERTYKRIAILTLLVQNVFINDNWVANKYLERYKKVSLTKRVMMMH